MSDRVFVWLLFLVVVLGLFLLAGYGCAMISQGIWPESISA
jgi:hypothetical protein